MSWIRIKKPCMRDGTWNLSAHPEPVLDHPVSVPGPTPLGVSMEPHQFMFQIKKDCDGDFQCTLLLQIC
jgi:hypothetical protein